MKTVIITGTSSGIGLDLVKTFDSNGYRVISLSRKTGLDASNYIELERCLNDLQPDYIFHLAAQSIVEKSYFHPTQTMTTNIIGVNNSIIG